MYRAYNVVILFSIFFFLLLSPQLHKGQDKICMQIKWRRENWTHTKKKNKMQNKKDSTNPRRFVLLPFLLFLLYFSLNYLVKIYCEGLFMFCLFCFVYFCTIDSDRFQFSDKSKYLDIVCMEANFGGTSTPCVRSIIIVEADTITLQ